MRNNYNANECLDVVADVCLYRILLVKNPCVHGLNTITVPGHNGGTIYRVAI